MSSRTTDAVAVTSADGVVDDGFAPLLPRWAVAGAAFVLACALVLRFLALSPLWLDEAQTVEIAGRSVPHLLDALRHDGSPPLYYLLLHVWMKIFGTGTFAVRALSGLISVAALPVMWRVARVIGASRRDAWVATLLLAANPFAIRYATETRMYSLVVLLWLLAFLAFRRVWLDRGVGWMVLAAAATAALVLTHYWSLFAVAAVGLAALAVVRRHRAAAVRVLVSLAVGCLGLLPWLSSFLFQLRHTGAPWGSPPSLSTVFLAPTSWAGEGPVGSDDLLAFAYYLLVGLALFGTATATAVVVGGRPRKPALWFLAVGFGTLLLGCGINLALGSAYASRYSAVALVPFLLVAAAGLRSLPPRWWAPSLAVVLTLGIVVSAALPARMRSEADEVAVALRAAKPHDVVVFCPDQLGPAVHRLAPRAGQQVVFPTMGSPAMVDWVDYEQRNEAADPSAFARSVLRRAGTAGAVWLVYADGYQTFSDDCSRLLIAIGTARGEPQIVVRSHKHVDERERLAYFPPSG
ncbi:MAG TPA: glycosyltransferase family 39 protein [Mycobacteriales bacterium]|nr:glycosyltransferase family 39 protein [Mycobacteriales bacterium]